MTLAIDGPIVSIVAPSGTLSATHWPASRPPGSPPVPASDDAACDGWIFDHFGTTSDSATAATAAYSQRRGSAASARPASSASSGAAGSRYW